MIKNIRSALMAFMIVFIIAPVSLYARERNNEIDSLKTALLKTSSDAERVKIFLRLAEKTDCNDSAKKIAYAELALSLAEKNKIIPDVINAQETEGRIYSLCFKDYSKAVSKFNQCATIAKKNGDTLNEIKAYFKMGLIFRQAGNLVKAIEYCRLALSLNPEPEDATSILGNMGINYTEVSDFSKAMECFNESYNILERNLKTKKNPNSQDSLTFAALLLGRGDIYLDMHNCEKAIENYDEATTIAKGNEYINMYVLIAKGNAYNDKQDYPNAIKQYHEALALCQNHQPEAIDIYQKLAGIYLKTGEIRLALENVQKAIDLVEQPNRAGQRPPVYNIVAKIKAQQKEYATAIDYLKKSIAGAGELGLVEEERDAWQTLNNIYESTNKKPEAYEAYKHYITLRDSIYNKGKNDELMRMDLEGGFARKQFADSLKQSAVYEGKMLRQRIISRSGYAILGLVVLFSVFIYRSLGQQKKANVTISKANETIKREKQVSETLLLNILPADVAEELKTKGKVKARLYDDVTVLFTDFVNFTKTGERLTPELLVAELDACFQAFDEIIGKYKIEKIKTVGDAYLAVSGLPYPNAGHASEIIKAAIEIRNFMEARQQQMGEQTFGIRLGVHTGKVVAGIVGAKKFAYDIWGDTVNTAARMEQSSQPGHINISYDTYKLVKDEFTFTYRGEIEAKHKGKLKMYYVG